MSVGVKLIKFIRQITKIKHRSEDIDCTYHYKKNKSVNMNMNLNMNMNMNTNMNMKVNMNEECRVAYNSQTKSNKKKVNIIMIIAYFSAYCLQ